MVFILDLALFHGQFQVKIATLDSNYLTGDFIYHQTVELIILNSNWYAFYWMSENLVMVLRCFIIRLIQLLDLGLTCASFVWLLFHLLVILLLVQTYQSCLGHHCLYLYFAFPHRKILYSAIAHTDYSFLMITL